MATSITSVFAHPEGQTFYSDEKPVLDVNLKRCSKQERGRMIHLINRLAQSKAGMEVLQTAVDGGYGFSFEAMDKAGVTRRETKDVVLNPVFSDDKLITTLCHESRHAGQQMRCDILDTVCEWDIKSQTAYFRAMEADAQAYAALAAEELSRRGDGKPKEIFSKVYPEIAAGAEKSLKKSSSREIGDTFLEDVFKSWYDQKRLKSSYEQGYLIRPLQNDNHRLELGGKPQLSFNVTVPADKIVNDIMQTKDGCYFRDNPDVLYGGKYLEIGKSSMSSLQELLKEREFETDEDYSSLLKGIPVYNDKKSNAAEENGAENNAGSSFFSRLKDRIKGLFGQTAQTSGMNELLPDKAEKASVKDEKALKIQKILENKRKTSRRKSQADVLRKKAARQGR